MITQQYKTGYVTDPQRVEVRFTNQWQDEDAELVDTRLRAACLLLLEVGEKHKAEKASMAERHRAELKKANRIIDEERESPTP